VLERDTPLLRAVAEIRGFWPDAPLAGVRQEDVRRVAAELQVALPWEVEEYLRTAVPLRDVVLLTEADPVRLWGVRGLGRRQDGYSYNPLLQEDLGDWNPDLLVVADRGGDPYVVPLSGGHDAPLQVQTAPHGAGRWRFEPVCSLATFLVLSTAEHRAMEMGDATGDYEAAEGFRTDIARRWDVRS
jgi:hypothetical protein